MERSQNKEKSIIVIGLSGKGKSSILNTLISGNPHGVEFRTASSRNPVTLSVSSKVSKLYGVQSENKFQLFDVPGVLGGEQNFSSWAGDFIAKIGQNQIRKLDSGQQKQDQNHILNNLCEQEPNEKHIQLADSDQLYYLLNISLVFLVFSKMDRIDEAGKVTCASIKDLLVRLSPNQIVLTLSRCEDGLNDEDKLDWMASMDEIFGKGFLYREPLQFKIPQMQSEQQQFAFLFNNRVYSLLEGARMDMVVNRETEFKNVIPELMKIIPQQYQEEQKRQMEQLKKQMKQELEKQMKQELDKQIKEQKEEQQKQLKLLEEQRIKDEAKRKQLEEKEKQQREAETKLKQIEEEQRQIAEREREREEQNDQRQAILLHMHRMQMEQRRHDSPGILSMVAETAMTLFMLKMQSGMKNL